ncbi:YggS family pyridoxal phosphate enzyme [Mycobacterium sp. CBMA293]|uniref:YggS family pyridoxal phosphate enzyme n=1 Tax=unclassified Mycolicibacterium TaxID=2636767 RepID=UPI0012DC289D|nr:MULTISPECIES: alanine racemase [unclassified Mycolicibacterium]MUL45466.1 YggS family pyridoxal phosphate enzyme [Mycolicibacterium sp. CBMA 360]MUL60136.1 YggS family pyridoxal phosphate enzyme [Mycolicibacterium sp. CBMA 335]MUL72923.1 YggS family pyridoxal phosphate enzyme [Mycolicibacterium sp. CBMA 311]MUL96102.1 YggS family pyridoxal phosphate enzyme [Mycolicibacterium sp. CBMA 230]MUM08117.1 YggS family pyridoxal phosphate enzyme [Mycolicibacterium sp. CBMA 213]
MTSAAREAELADSLARIQARIDAAAAASGRDRADIEFLPVTKFFPAADVVALYRLGCRAFGESREQEATAKIAKVTEASDALSSKELITAPGELLDASSNIESNSAIQWHMIGRIQRNKARAVAGWASVAHSVDSAPLIAALARGAVEALEQGRRSAPLQVYIQVSLDGDPARGGVPVGRPDLVDELCAAAHGTPGLQLAGLMAIPPLATDVEQEFARLEAELLRVQTQYPHRLGLSAGMSDDLEVAVRHGSTCVRVGTALMGRRPLTSP